MIQKYLFETFRVNQIEKVFINAKTCAVGKTAYGKPVAVQAR